jgi:uncharacterized membrane protein YfcA
VTLRRVVALVATGLTGGFLSGMFGVGGGIIMVPMLIWFAGLDQRRASATSLAAIVPGAIAGSVSYAVNGEVDWIAGALVAAGGIAGSFLGTHLLRRLPLGWLRWLFIALLLAISVRMLFEFPSSSTEIALSPWAVVGLVALGVFMGVASGLFGIGGGVLMVPILITLFGAGELIAKGTSLLAMIPTSITGTVQNTRHSLVDLKDAAVAGAAATAASFGGVAVAFLLDPRLSAVLFAILVFLIAAQLTFRTIREIRRP